MSDNANTILTDFLKALPEHTRENVAFRVVSLIRPDIEFGPETDWEALAYDTINPERTGGGLDPKHGAAVIWSGLLDYVFHRDMPFPTSAEMHKAADGYYEKHGHESGHMREIADRQDSVNADFAAAEAAWQELRAGPLSISSLHKAWWNREQRWLDAEQPPAS